MPQQEGQSALTITRVAGTCGWQATTDKSWLTLDATSGTGSATVTIHWETDLYLPRSATITLRWSGASAQVVVNQTSSYIPDNCSATVTVDGQSIPVNVPSAGGTYTVRMNYSGNPSGPCLNWTARCSWWELPTQLSGPNIPASFTVTVPANPLHTDRTLWIFISFFNYVSRDLIQVELRQSGSP